MSSNADSLIVLLDGRQAGVVHRERPRSTSTRLRFVYDLAWRRARDAYPLSLTMPLAAAEHEHAAISAYLYGLLPDNEQILDRWSKRFQVPNTAFSLLSCVGEDCAGAVQLVRPERVEAAQKPGRTVWLAEPEIAERLRALHDDQGAWRSDTDRGQFSLGGAQPKIALTLRGDRFGIPSGRTPTTHILKPPIAGLAGHVENEHLCLSLARALGLPAAHSRVRAFEDETVIVVERFDRVTSGKSVARIHQEDMCQALGLLPALKYQNQGGPSPEQIAQLLKRSSSDPVADLASFVDALIFNWLIGGSDAHAKNYSLLHGHGSAVRLAPLYDIAGVLPYTHSKKIRLAMKIGGSYQLTMIGLRHWRKLADAIGERPDTVVDRARDMVRRIPAALDEVHSTMTSDGLTHPVIAKLTRLIHARAEGVIA